jgi:hypothetical protein
MSGAELFRAVLTGSPTVSPTVSRACHWQACRYRHEGVPQIRVDISTEGNEWSYGGR